jgi:hypothetical protein
VQEATNDDHRMRPHDVDHRVASKFTELVGADHSVVVAAPYIIYARLEFNEIVNVGSIFDGPIRLSGNPPLALPLAICSNAASIRS